MIAHGVRTYIFTVHFARCGKISSLDRSRECQHFSGSYSEAQQGERDARQCSADMVQIG